MQRSGLPSAAGAALAAALLATPLTAGAELKILAPPDGARLASATVILIGVGTEGALTVTLNEHKIGGIKQSGKAFTGPLKLSAGKNVLLVKSGAEIRQLTFVFDAADKTSAAIYRYHDPVAGGECKACHPQGVGRTSPVTESKLCNTCHDPKTGSKYLHGPLGAGQCTICHDPHGSANPRFLVMGVRMLCTLCHAQSRSQQHIERAANKLCPECHDPHGSEKKYLLQ